MCIKLRSADTVTRRGTPGLPSLLILQLSLLLPWVFTWLHHEPDTGMHPGWISLIFSQNAYKLAVFPCMLHLALTGMLVPTWVTLWGQDCLYSERVEQFMELSQIVPTRTKNGVYIWNNPKRNNTDFFLKQHLKSKCFCLAIALKAR